MLKLEVYKLLADQRWKHDDHQNEIKVNKQLY